MQLVEWWLNSSPFSIYFPNHMEPKTMASLPKNTLTTIIFYFILLSSFSHLSNGVFSEKLSEAISLKQMAKTTHLHFFFHDIHSGKTPSVVRVAGSPGPSWFGTTYVIDNDLTEEQDASSKLVGKAQGMYAFTAQNDITLMMVMTCVFTEGEFNGSSISVLGRNPWLEDVRELPIVGGSGRFRYATGYALLHNVFLDIESGDAIVEYNVYVTHY